MNLSTGRVENNVRLAATVHGNGDFDEIVTIEKNVLKDERVKAAIAELELPEGAVVIADPWTYGKTLSHRHSQSLRRPGSDGIDDDKRLFQVWLYMRDPKNSSEADSNYYAFPLPISPVVESNEYKVVRIDRLPTGADGKASALKPWQPAPPNEYISDYQKLRTDVKPLRVVQPEGASFRLTSGGESHVLDWQKWSFRIGFNQREGMVLYNVYYDGRPLFYRLSLSDMNIPYADPRHPFHRKAAYDLGDAGAGSTANNLKLGCDCLGHIQYISATISDDKGGAVNLENCICLHEQDNGVGWKHTNYRTGRAAIVRNREFVVQSVITVSNYEYILAFIFNQAGELSYEVRATGILSTQPIDRGLDKEGVPFGTVVHPGTLAVHHQHLFSLRIDPMIEGLNNSLVYNEAHAMPLSESKNPYGVGYEVTETLVEHSAGLDLNADTNRVFKIQNSSARSPINGKAMGYKIQVPPFQKMLAHPSSFHHKRAEFADKNIYVTKYAEKELYSAGWYTIQSRGGTGVRSWAARRDPVVDTDIVVWVQFGMNHITRIEDFPVMPCEHMRVSLKPVNFFDKNPALDVPPSTQTVNGSVLISGNGVNGHANDGHAVSGHD